MSALPAGWAEATIDDLRAPVPNAIADGPYGSSLKTSHYRSEGARVIRLGNIGAREFLDSDVAYISPTHFKVLAKHHVAPGDVIVAALGDPVGRACLAPSDLGPALVKADCFRVRPSSQVSAAFLMLWLNSDCARTAFSQSAHGMGRVRINLSDLRSTIIPVPPEAEQRRIVGKIDSLSAKSKRSRDHLVHIPKLVQKYKQAILAAAFRGELAQEGRKKTSDKRPRFVPLREICASISDGDHQAPPRADTGVPFITIAAMNEGVIDLRKVTRFVPRSYFNGLHPTRRPSYGDVLYSVTGSFGIPALVDFDEPFVFQRHIAILKPNHEKVEAAFLFRLLSAPQIIEQASAVATGTAQMTISLSGLREFLFPYLSLEEQREVSRRIEIAFAWIDRLASEASSACRLIDHLDQAILVRAFRGQLVPQDPSDEPAGVLLERIRAERTAPAARTEPARSRRRQQ